MAYDVASEMQAVLTEMNTPDDSHSSTEETTQNTESTPQSADTSTASESTESSEPKGPLPFERHKDILENTRKTYETQLSELNAKLERLKWADTYDPNEVQSYRDQMNLARQNPAAYLQWLESRFKSDPTTAAFFSGTPQASPAQEDPKPPPDVLLEDGSKVYSDSQQEKLLAWQERRLEQRFMEKLKPVLERHELQDVDTRAQRTAKEIFAEAQTWEGFNDHVKEIADLMESDGRVTVESAYRRIVVPALKKQVQEVEAETRRKVLEELRQKPAASGTAKPGAAQTDPVTYKGKSTREIMELVMREAAG